MQLNSSIEVFLIGTLGGVLLELLHWYKLRHDEHWPDYIRSPGYWILSLAMALVGGSVAWIYFGTRADAILVLHTGLSTPLILEKAASTVALQPGVKGGGSRQWIRFFDW